MWMLTKAWNTLIIVILVTVLLPSFVKGIGFKIGDSHGGSERLLHFENRCGQAIQIAVVYFRLVDPQKPGGVEEFSGWWEIGPNQAVYLSDEYGNRIYSNRSHVLYYARTKDGRLEWRGDYSRNVDGQILQMKDRLLVPNRVLASFICR